MRLRHWIIVPLAAGMALALLGCSSSSGPAGTVTINTRAARLLVNSWGMFTARVTGLSNLTATWTMEPPGYGAVTHVRDNNWITHNLVLVKMPHTAGGHALIASSTLSSTIRDVIPVVIVDSWTPSTPLDNYNGSATTGTAPTSPTTFTLGAETRIVKISVYHAGFSTLPTGTVTLTSGATTYGPYQTVPKFTVIDEGLPTEDYTLDPSQWDVLLDVLLPAGTYTVTSSSAANWSNNAGSSFKGMATITAAT
ncbi:MAG: hypothetical protein ACYC7E_21970 [Armatimonadota bacterium]